MNRSEADGVSDRKSSLLVMANKGPNTNQSQWFITLAAADHLTGKHVVFGRVQSGFHVVQEIGELETDTKHRPLGGPDVVLIVHCGQLERKQKPRPVIPTAEPSVKGCVPNPTSSLAAHGSCCPLMIADSIPMLRRSLFVFA